MKPKGKFTQWRLAAAVLALGHPQTNENPRLDGPSETVGYMTYKGK